MAHIKSRPEIPIGYFHAGDDGVKTATAVRASYQPSLSNRITNQFARREHPALAGFVNRFRVLDLSLRQAVNQRRLNGARARFDAMDEEGKATGPASQGAGKPILRLQHKQDRLDTKQVLAQVALAGQLSEGLQIATEGLQDKLRENGFVPLTGLRAVNSETSKSSYLIAPSDGHRIQINAERPPRLARLIADSVSADYDRGASGAGRAIRNTARLALAGIYRADQSVKGVAMRSMAGSEFLDAGARARMEVRSARTDANRTLVQAALRGNESLNAAYRITVQDQLGQARDRKANPNGPEYEVHSAAGGIRPPQTHFLDRRIAAYYRAKAPEASGGAGVATPPSEHRAGAIARFAIGVTNLRGQAVRTLHNAQKRSAVARMERSEDPEERKRHEMSSAWHTAIAAKQDYVIKTRRSILEGKLIETLRDPTKSERMTEAFAQLQTIERREQEAPTVHDDEDLYDNN